MSKFQGYNHDIEAQNIALNLQEKYEGLFSGHDIERVGFFRIKDKDSKEPAKVISTGFPFDVYSDKVYFVVIYGKYWELMSNEQRIVTVFQQLMSMHPEGFDPESNNYAKIRKRDVNEYSEVLSAVALRYDWKEIGVDGVPNLLADDVTEKEKPKTATDDVVKNVDKQIIDEEMNEDEELDDEEDGDEQ